MLKSSGTASWYTQKSEQVCKVTSRGAPRRSVPCRCSFTESNYHASLAFRVKQQKAKGLLPSLELSKRQAVERQLQASSK